MDRSSSSTKAAATLAILSEGCILSPCPLFSPIDTHVHTTICTINEAFCFCTPYPKLNDWRQECA